MIQKNFKRVIRLDTILCGRQDVKIQEISALLFLLLLLVKTIISLIIVT